MVNIKPILVSLLVIGLFAMGIISFGIRLAEINEAPQSIGDDPSISRFRSQLNESLAQANEDAIAGQQAIEESPTTINLGLYIIDAIGGVWKTLISVPITLYNLTVGFLFENVFAGNSFAIALGIIGAIIGISVILAVWKLVSTGEG